MFVLYVLTICIFASICNASLNVHDRMYVLLEATSPCVMRFNGTHSFGCTSSRNGNVGVIHLAYNDSELNWVLNSSPMDSYIVGITFNMFSLENLKKMNASSKIQGVLLMQNISRAEVPSFSPEDTCPNRYSGLAAPPIRQNSCDEPWNEKGSSIMLQNWKIPIFFTNDKDTINKIDDCFHKFNLPLDETQSVRSLCALEMTSHMYGSVNSPTCLRRGSNDYSFNPIRFCEPLGDENIYAPIVPLANYKHKNYIVVAARLDAASLFYGHTPGALAAATSLVSLLLTAKLLYQLTQNADFGKYEKNVLFVVFNGEAYDYIGSSRVVYDLKRGQFPFKEKAMSKDDIKLYIELSQLFNESELIYHTASSEVDPFVEKFKNIAQKHLPVTLSKSTRATIPPSSMQSFLALNSKLPGLVFSSYDKRFRNQYYHSIYDDEFNIKYVFSNDSASLNNSLQEYIAAFSTTLAHTLYEMISNQPAPATEVITKEESNQVLDCYVDTMNCEYLRKLGIVYSTQQIKPDYYVSVRVVSNQITTLTKYFITYFMGKNTSITDEEQCVERAETTHSAYIWIAAKKLCIESTANFTQAVSPAFVIDNYDMTSGQYSTWTESSWQLISVRMFVKPSRSYEWLVFIIGVIILTASFAITFWINRNAKELFNYPNLITASNI